MAYPLTNLEISLASRLEYDDQSSSDNKKNCMASFAYRKDFLLRGSWTETFRAPDMHYIYSQPSSVSYGLTWDAEYVNGYLIHKL